jgi:hypothetical protein
MSKEKARAQQKAIYANWDGKENNSKGCKMKITKEQAKKLLEQIKTIEEKFDGNCPDCGAPLDDEERHRCGDYGSGRGYGYRSSPRRSYFSRPAPVAPAGAEDTKWMKYLPSFRSKEWNKGKTDDQLKPLILAWLAKQQPKIATPAAPIAESQLVLETKKELLESASQLLVQAKEAWKKRK